MYCLFGVKPSFISGSKIEVYKPLQNDVKSCQRHRNDLSVWRSVLDCPSKTKKGGQTLNAKCRKVDLYWKTAYTKWREFISRASERPKTSRFFQEVRLLPMRSLKKFEHERTRGRGRKKIKTRIERSNFCRFSADFRVLGPPSKNSKCHNSINIGS